MKITREDLIHIIKEELEAVTGLQEQEAQEGEEVVQKAMQIKDHPEVQEFLAKLKDPTNTDPELEKVRAAMERVVAELPQETMEEEKYKTGKLAKGPENMDMQKVGIPGAMAAASWAASGGLSTGAGLALKTALIPALGAAGAGLATAGVAIAAPLALAYLIDVMRDK